MILERLLTEAEHIAKPPTCADSYKSYACGICDCPPAWAYPDESELGVYKPIWQMTKEEIEDMKNRVIEYDPYSPSDYVARYYPATNKIRLGPGFFNLNSKNRCKAVFHEIGHWVYDEFLKLHYSMAHELSLLGRWITVDGKQVFDGIFNTDSEEEAFAEAWATLVTDPERLKDTYPEVYSLFNGIKRDVCSIRDPDIPYQRNPYPEELVSLACPIVPGGLLYHVTTNKEAVKSQGLKTRTELGYDEGPGLGGGPSDKISFTTDQHIANSIEFVLREAIDVLRGKKTPEELVREAQLGINAPKPFYDQLLGIIAGHVIEDEDNRYRAEELLNQILYLINHKQKTKVSVLGKLVSELPPGASATRSWKRSDGSEIVFEWREPATDEEARQELWEFYNKFLWARETVGGMMNPVFFCTDIERLAQHSPEDVTALTYTYASDAELQRLLKETKDLVSVSGLDEIRLSSGRSVIPYDEWARKTGAAPDIVKSGLLEQGEIQLPSVCEEHPVVASKREG